MTKLQTNPARFIPSIGLRNERMVEPRRFTEPLMGTVLAFIKPIHNEKASGCTCLPIVCLMDIARFIFPLHD
ncbi:hypothetical protein B6A27_02120 [Anoxybacillus sp. UARK-01]|jgi:hypothetical protein|nr:hypothetical protein B6A27_02120 [Anoxybacillus sp. UARK-01]